MDWTQRGFVVIDIYYDTVEILSPGWFIEGQDPERHLAGLDKDSTTRNGLIARTLFRSKEIESYGSGMPRIKELCDEAGVRVEYRQQHDGTLLVFHRRDAFVGIGKGLSSHDEGMGETINETIKETNKVVNSLDSDELAVVGYMAIHPSATYESVAATTGFSRAKVGRIIQSLRERGVITREGSRKAGSWRIVRGVSNG